ncbi:hypothetical protein IV102_29015 [bacterium]|nr:hypothetical protein [bacterium]
MSSLRAQLEAHLGVSLRPSSWPELGDLVGRGGLPQENAWARCSEQAGCLQVRYRDPVLLGLGRTGARGRARLAAELATRLQAEPGCVIEADFRALWLSLESLNHRPHRGLREKTVARLDGLYESQALAGYVQAEQRFPRLAQWALLAGALERV